ncbi:hypothetical protein ACQE7U_27915, partial [Klebsiella pneumoniae]
WVHVQLHQQKGMISLSPPTICNSARERVLRAIQDEREARRAQEMRREKYEATETTFTWQPQRRR